MELVRDFAQQKIIESDCRMNEAASVEITGSLAEGLGIPEYHLSNQVDLIVDTADTVELVCKEAWYRFEDVPVEFGQYREGPMLEVQDINEGCAHLRIADGYKVGTNAVRGEAVGEDYLDTIGAVQRMFSVEDATTICDEDSGRHLALAFKGLASSCSGLADTPSTQWLA